MAQNSEQNCCFNPKMSSTTKCPLQQNVQYKKISSTTKCPVHSVFQTSIVGPRLIYFRVGLQGKSTPYEFDTKVPFYVRGPKIPAGQSRSEIALNIDIAPTILGLAGIKAPADMDGINLAGIWRGYHNETRIGSINLCFKFIPLENLRIEF